MAKGGSDALTGLLLAFVGIGILIAWRTGALSALLGGDLYGGGSVAQAGTGLRAAADALGNRPPTIATLPPRPGGMAAAGTVEDSYSSTVAPLAVAPWAAGGFLDESSRAARRAIATQIYTPIREIVGMVQLTERTGSTDAGGGSALVA